MGPGAVNQRAAVLYDRTDAPTIRRPGGRTRRRREQGPGRDTLTNIGDHNAAHGAEAIGLRNLKAVHWNLEAPRLYEESLARNESRLARGGALVATTGSHTGRSPKDKFVVRDAATESEIWWDNNGAITPDQFETLLADFLAHAKAASCSPRTSTAAPIPPTGSRPGSSPSSPGTRCSSATC